MRSEGFRRVLWVVLPALAVVITGLPGDTGARAQEAPPEVSAATAAIGAATPLRIPTPLVALTPSETPYASPTPTPTPEPVSYEDVQPYLEAEIEVTPPEDFWDFWDDSLAELRKTPPEFTWEPILVKTTNKLVWMKLTFQNIDGQEIEGIYIYPTEKKKVPAILYLHGYAGIETSLTEHALQGFAALSINWRGNKNVEDYYILDGILTPEDYVMRRAVLAAVRGIQALQDRKEVDDSRIGITADSFGGGLGLAASALLPGQIKFVYAASGGPAYRFEDDGTPADSQGEMYFIREFVEQNPNLEGVVRQTLRYFDIVSFAPRVDSSVLLHTSLQDTVATPMQSLSIYKALDPPGRDRKKILVFRRGGIGQGPIWGLKNAVEDWLGKQVEL